MKKFEFTLQKLYEVKKITENQLMREQEQINKKLNDLQNQKGALVLKFADERDLYDEDCKRGIHAQEMQSYGDYFDFLMDSLKKLQEKIQKCQAEKEKCTQALVKIMNEIKVLDKIKEEQFIEYNKELQKNDDKMLEDFLCGRM
jgi:flagellar export protein FliJ